MTTFLLDANLSPKTARFLSSTFGFDVLSLQGSHLGELPDPAVIEMARSQGRVIITLDRDYVAAFMRPNPPRVGIIYLDLPNTHRYIPEINRILERFFRTQAATINLEQTLVTITESAVSIVHRA